MLKYNARMAHNRDTITKLIETQYKTFNLGSTALLYLLSFGLIIYGLYADKNMYTPWIAVFAGCFLIGNSRFSQKSTVKKVLQQINGKYPVSDYSFEEKGFRAAADGDLVPYSSIIRLVDDKKYLYLYISKTAAFMVDKSTVSPGGADDLKAFLAKEAKTDFSKSGGLLGINLWGIIKNIRSSIALKKK